jgi:hypothetical protein
MKTTNLTPFLIIPLCTCAHIQYAVQQQTAGAVNVQKLIRIDTKTITWQRQTGNQND